MPLAAIEQKGAIARTEGAEEAAEQQREAVIVKLKPIAQHQEEAGAAPQQEPFAPEPTTDGKQAARRLRSLTEVRDFH